MIYPEDVGECPSWHQANGFLESEPMLSAKADSAKYTLDYLIFQENYLQTIQNKLNMQELRYNYYDDK